MSAENKKQLNVRIPIELYEKVSHDEKPIVDLVTEAIECYFKNAINKDSKAINDDINELKFYNESEFHIWFADNYDLMGFNKIIEQSTNSFPDFILEKDGKEIKVELETLASNFKLHGHDPSLVDLVICLRKDTELPVKTIELPLKFIGNNITTLRMSDEMLAKLDDVRGEKTRSEYCREVFKLHVNKTPDKINSNHPVDDYADQKLIEQLSGQVRFLEGKLDEANRLLLNEQTLHLATQRLLPPAQNKPWYRFWK